MDSRKWRLESLSHLECLHIPQLKIYTFSACHCLVRLFMFSFVSTVNDVRLNWLANSLWNLMLPVGNSPFNMTVNVAHLVSWLSVLFISAGCVLVWAGHFGCFMAVSPSAVSVHIQPGLDHCPKRCLIPYQELLYCLLWHVVKIQTYRATTQHLRSLRRNCTWICYLVQMHVLMDGKFTGPCGYQSQIMPESCLG